MDSIASVRLEPIMVFGSILPLAGGAAAHSGIPACVVTLAPRDMAVTRPQQLADLLVERPAATRYDDLGSPFKHTIVMRGFAASPVAGVTQGVTVLVDGIPTNEPGAGEVSFELLPLEAVERVEILSGTASLVGPNSLGGAINLVTRRGGERTHGHATLEVGSHGARGAQAGAG